MPKHPPMQTQDVAMLSATELMSLYRRKELSPVEVLEAALSRVDAFDGIVNAFRQVDADAAKEAARASEKRWLDGEPLGLVDGVPTTIKDLVLARGWPTLRGSRVTDPNQSWDEDAPATARLREHGAVLLGKTTTPEFGWKGVTDSPLTGITRNPWNTNCTPGGSSGGAAVAAALGMGALHIGTDGGGSVRIPAGFTGIFGHKPSYGRVPAYPASQFPNLAHVGQMTRSVGDAALMLTVMSQPDARDWTALPYDGRDYRVGLDEGVSGLRIAFSPTLGFADVDPSVEDKVRAAVQTLGDLGANVEEIDPGFESPRSLFLTLWFSGVARMIANFTDEQRELLDPGLLHIAEMGAETTLADYLKVSADRIALGEHMKRFHETYDLLVTPTLPIPAFDAGIDFPSKDVYARWADWTPFTYPFNLTQQPACSVPCGFTPDGLPVGLQIIGPMFDDALVLRAARAFESAQPFVMPEAPIGKHGA
jgi:aspartyl-tRNA(Asn)/glutamyl-tRNA(Gln) amidotransferase subunit A